MQQPIVRKTDTQTLAVTEGAYSAGDVFGGLITFDLDGKSGGWLSDFSLVDSDNVGAALTLYLFDSEPTAIADNAAFATAITAADRLAQVGEAISIASGDYTTLNSIQRAFKALSQDGTPYEFEGKLYGYLVTGGTPTFTNADAVAIKLGSWLY